MEVKEKVELYLSAFMAGYRVNFKIMYNDSSCSFFDLGKCTN